MSRALCYNCGAPASRTAFDTKQNRCIPCHMVEVHGKSAATRRMVRRIVYREFRKPPMDQWVCGLFRMLLWKLRRKVYNAKSRDNVYMVRLDNLRKPD